jgi:hypothetical protein
MKADCARKLAMTLNFSSVSEIPLVLHYYNKITLIFIMDDISMDMDDPINEQEDSVDIDKVDIYEECKKKCRISIIIKYIARYPLVLAQPGHLGYLPLHCLLWNNLSSIEDAVMMMEKYPAALEYLSRDHFLPIHIECLYRCRSSLIAQFVNVYPEGLSQADIYGHTPLHWLLYNTSSSTDDALLLIETNPAVLKLRSNHNQLPIHLEGVKQCRPMVLSKCIELYPESVDDRTILVVMQHVDKDNFPQYITVLSIAFTLHPTSFYDYLTYLREGDVRADPCIRRRILNLLPRHTFTPTHETDYHDLNWRPRSAIMKLLLQIKIQRQQS